MNDKNMRGCPLFLGIGDHELERLLGCLGARRRNYNKDEFVFKAQSKAASVGIVLSGAAHVMQEDYWGNRSILAYIGPGGMFGEAFSCAWTDELPVNVAAVERSEIMLIDYRKIVTTCPASCAFHAQLIKNMLRILAQKNIMLTRKAEHLSKRTTREKLLSFLGEQAALAKSCAVEIPFNRQELADYLCVDRSALSRELSLMRGDGILRYDKNKFELLRNED